MKKIIYLDILRILAMIAVVIMHATGGMINSSSENYILETYQNLSRWCVPIFIMISGFLFLNNNKPFKKILSKNFVRIMTAFIFWTILFNILLYFTKKPLVLFYYHLWFLPMLAGIYLLIPFLRAIVSNKKILKYFLVLWLVYIVLLPSILEAISVFDIEIANYLYKYVCSFELYLPMGYVGYFLLGYYIGTENFSIKARNIIYGISIACVIVCLFGVPTGQFYREYYGNLYLLPYVCLLSICLFLFAKYNLNKELKNIKFITTLSKLSFGVYLVHPLVYSFLHRLGIEVYLGNPAFGVFVFIGLILVFSFIISGIINQIPILKKYII